MESKYKRIKEDIIKMINDGSFVPGGKIYSEKEIKEKYSVSSITAVKALNELQLEGYIVRRRGKGSFVRKNLSKKRALVTETRPKNLSKLDNEKSIFSVEENVKNPTVSSILGDKASQKSLLKLHEVGYINEIPWKFQDRYVFKDLITATDKKKLLSGYSLSKELDLNNNMVLMPTEMEVECIQVKDEKSLIVEINRIGIIDVYDLNSVMFKVTKVFYHKDGTPISYLVSYLNPKFYKLKISIE